MNTASYIPYGVLYISQTTVIHQGGSAHLAQELLCRAHLRWKDALDNALGRWGSGLIHQCVVSISVRTKP